MMIIDNDYDRVLIRLTKKEFLILANPINETKEALADWEISTRVGTEPAELEELQREFSKLLRET